MLLKKLERGEEVPLTIGAEKLQNARKQDSIKFAVVMDDKTFKIEITWKAIKEHSETSLAEFVLRQMRGMQETTH